MHNKLQVLGLYLVYGVEEGGTYLIALGVGQGCQNKALVLDAAHLIISCGPISKIYCDVALLENSF